MLLPCHVQSLARVEVAGPDLSLVEVRAEGRVLQLTLSVADCLAAPTLPAAGGEDRPGPPHQAHLLLSPSSLLHRAARPTVAPVPGDVLGARCDCGGAPT